METHFARAQRSGWSDDPADAGGATMCGVTLATYRSWCAVKGYARPGKAELKKIPYAHWRAIFVSNFWNYCHADRIRSESVAWIIVDWVWSSGPKVIKRVQRVLGVNPDGIIGPKTLAAINEDTPEELFADIKRDRFAYLDEICKSRPANIRFLKGWENRLNALEFDNLNIYE